MSSIHTLDTTEKLLLRADARQGYNMIGEMLHKQNKWHRTKCVCWELEAEFNTLWKLDNN